MLTRPESFRPELLFSLTGRLLFIVLFNEVLIMLAFQLFGLNTLPEPAEAILDGVLLTVLSAIPIYFWIIVPVLRERRRTDEMLHLLAAAIQNATEAIIITDSKATIEYVNPAFSQITGYSKSEAIGNNPRMLQSGKQDKAFYIEMWRVLTTTGKWQGKVWNRRKNGEVYHEALNIRAIFDANGEVTHYLGTFSDTTEQDQMERMLLQAQKMDALGTLVGGVAHNFNNMIAGITGKTYLAERSTDDPKVLGFLREIDQISQRAADIVRQLLLFSREVHQEKQHVNLTTLFQSACRTARFGVPENIAFETRFCKEDLIAYADAAQLEQVLINLINNARDACMGQPNPRITVSLKRLSWESFTQRDKFKICASEIACLEVEDTGIGIPEAEIEHIFDPFYTTKEAGAGTGLGLSMSYGAIESHGGVIDVQSTVGKGTRFVVGIPIVNEELIPVMPETATEVVVSSSSADLLVMIVDDEEMIRSTLSQILQSLGYKVITATNGQEACDLFDQHGERISLVMTDRVMPKLDGERALEQMRRTRPELPAIIISGYSSEESDLDDITKLVSKPFRIAKISKVVSELLQKPAKTTPPVHR